MPLAKANGARGSAATSSHTRGYRLCVAILGSLHRVATPASYKARNFRCCVVKGSVRPPPVTMRIVVADECGLMKQVVVETGKVLGLPWGTHTREHGVQRMCWAGLGDQPEEAVAAVTNQGVVQTWRPGTRTVTSTFALDFSAKDGSDADSDDKSSESADDDDAEPVSVAALQLLRSRWVA